MKGYRTPNPQYSGKRRREMLGPNAWIKSCPGSGMVARAYGPSYLRGGRNARAQVFGASLIYIIIN